MAGTGPRTGYVLVLRLELSDVPGTLGRVTTAIGEDGGDIGTIDLVGQFGRKVLREVTVTCRNEAHARELTAKVEAVEGVRVLEVGDRTFLAHQGGKLAVVSKLPLKSPDDLAVAYTPGVGRVSQAIAADPERVWDLTIKGNSVAVLTDGTAVLGLGAIGPQAAMPVMEGKAALFKEFAEIDAYPICVDAAGPEEVIAVAKAIAPGFGGINLEDIAAPACFEVEERLRRELDIPVFHDDQHGTAVVVLAALQNACRVVGKRLPELRVVVLGAGAAGAACAGLLAHAGVRDLVVVDLGGILHPGRGDLDPRRRALAERSNPRGLAGGLEVALAGADAFVGVSGPGALPPALAATMADDAIVFALANPVPEILPDEVPANVAVVATGRSDFPNQINNVLVFPGFFRGLLDARARSVTDEMKAAAARGLALLVDDRELDADLIIPSVFDRRVAPAVSRAVQESVEQTGLSRLVEPSPPER
jgi:malate dehydrogenase (oxaloacetate-decarboxylating)